MEKFLRTEDGFVYDWSPIMEQTGRYILFTAKDAKDAHAIAQRVFKKRQKELEQQRKEALAAAALDGVVLEEEEDDVLPGTPIPNGG